MGGALTLRGRNGGGAAKAGCIEHLGGGLVGELTFLRCLDFVVWRKSEKFAV